MYLNNPILILPCCNSYQFAVKRKAVGIWGCKDCGKVKAGGAYTMKYVSVCKLLLNVLFIVISFYANLDLLIAALLVPSLSGAQSVA
jgi:hypothetical protein